MKRLLMLVAASILIASSGAIAQEQPEAPVSPPESQVSPPEAQVSPSVQAGLDWLALVDKGEFGPSWDAAGVYLKQVVAQEQFVQALTAARLPFETFISRQFVSSSPQTTLEGGPDGEYDVLVFQSAFSKKAEATETMTLMKDADGVWRVLGYIIR